MAATTLGHGTTKSTGGGTTASVAPITGLKVTITQSTTK